MKQYENLILKGGNERVANFLCQNRGSIMDLLWFHVDFFGFYVDIFNK